MSDIANTLASRLRAARKSTNLTQKEVAQLLGRSGAVISVYEQEGENNTQPSLQDIEKFAEIYNTSPSYLVGWAEFKETKTQAKGILTVPLLSPSELAKWDFSQSTEFIQCVNSYPPAVAAAFKVNSNAMSSLSSSSDYYAVVQRDHITKVDKIYAIVESKQNHPTLRRCVMDGGTTLFVADDNKYPTFRREDIRIIGRVTEIIRHTIL